MLSRPSQGQRNEQRGIRLGPCHNRSRDRSRFGDWSSYAPPSGCRQFDEPERALFTRRKRNRVRARVLELELVLGSLWFPFLPYCPKRSLNISPSREGFHWIPAQPYEPITTTKDETRRIEGFGHGA
jgi:hypothetical protein